MQFVVWGGCPETGIRTRFIGLYQASASYFEHLMILSMTVALE